MNDLSGYEAGLARGNASVASGPGEYVDYGQSGSGRIADVFQDYTRRRSDINGVFQAESYLYNSALLTIGAAVTIAVAPAAAMAAFEGGALAVGSLLARPLLHNEAGIFDADLIAGNAIGGASLGVGGTYAVAAKTGALEAGADIVTDGLRVAERGTGSVWHATATPGAA